jgi:hypothetical protein
MGKDTPKTGQQLQLIVCLVTLIYSKNKIINKQPTTTKTLFKTPQKFSPLCLKDHFFKQKKKKIHKTH